MPDFHVHVLVNVNVNVPERRCTELDRQPGEADCYEVAIGYVHAQEHVHVHEAPPLTGPSAFPQSPLFP
jgi:hypothetical protein